jgi:hypothetical protein
MSNTTITTSQRIIKYNDYNYNNWTQIRLYQDPYLKIEKRESEHITILIDETRGTPDIKTNFQKKQKP